MDVTEETAIGGTQDRFQPTLWTIVLKAKDASSPERRQALERLIEAYWKPAYYFIRRRGNNIEGAKDLTQAFFTAFLEKDFLKNVTPEKGKFRSFLQASLTYFLTDEYRESQTIKRGARFDFVQPGPDLESDGATPESAFFKQWAVETMSQAIARLKKECSAEEFALLTGGGPEGLSPSDKKNRLHSLRARLRRHLRDIIRPSVQLESDIDEEIRALFSM